MAAFDAARMCVDISDTDVMSCICDCSSHTPLTYNESETITGIVRNALKAENYRGRSPCLRDVGVYVAPNHNMCADGEYRGFRLTLASDILARAMPMTRSMFHGHTCAEIDVAAAEAVCMRLLCTPVAELRATMLSFCAKVHSASQGREPSLACVPSNATSPLSGASMLLYAPRSKNVRDSRAWCPELPSRIGIYHAYSRDARNGKRIHRLFVICSGGCVRAGDELYNLMVDVGGDVSVAEFCSSEEAWWLRNCNHRMRRWLNFMLCEAFAVPVSRGDDPYAYEAAPGAVQLATSTVNTCDYDIEACPSSDAVLNGPRHVCKCDAPRSELSCSQCTPRRCGAVVRRRDYFSYSNQSTFWKSNRDTMLSSMYPCEGYWLMQGDTGPASGESPAAVGHRITLPTATFPVADVFGNNKMHSVSRDISTVTCEHHSRTVSATYVRVRNDERVVVYDTATGAEAAESVDGIYQFPNDTYLRVVQSMGWSRDNGLVELMPIVVAVVY